MKEMKAVVVAGATGFIGGALTKKLLLEGKKVYAVSTNEKKLEELKQYGNLVAINANYEEYKNIPDLINEEISAWFHIAWKGASNHITDDLDSQLINIKYSCEALLIAKKSRVEKFVFIGSAYKYRILEKESYSYNPSIYGISKAACESILKTLAVKNSIEFNSVIFNNIFGVGDTSNRSTNSLIRQFKNNDCPRLIKGDQLYDCTYIDDAVRGIMAIAFKGINQKSYYVGSRKLRSFEDITRELASVISPDMSLTFGEYEDASYVDYSKVNLEELYEDTGFYCQCDFKESILKTAQWLENLKI